MSVHTDEHLDLCAAQAIGVIADFDRRRLEDHLHGGCARCEETLQDFAGSVLVLARASAPSAPSSGLQRQILSEAAAERGRRPVRRQEVTHTASAVRYSTIMTWKGWMFLYAAVVLGGIAAYLGGRLRETQAELAETKGLLNRSSSQLAEAARWDAVATAPNARAAMLEPTRAAAGGSRGRVVLDPDTHRALVVCDRLPGTARGAWRVWALGAKGATPLAVLHPDVSGHAVGRIEAVRGEPQAIAVTLEPPGAATSARPSGPVMMLARFAR